MIRRHFRVKAAGQRTQQPGQDLHEPCILGDFHDTRPKGDDTDEPRRDHNRLFAAFEHSSVTS